MTSVRRYLPMFTTLLVLGATDSAFAQTGRSGDATQRNQSLEATKLFFEARRLLRENELGAACRLFEQSHRIEPTLATFLNLGFCHRFGGRLATAHDYYRQAEVIATLARDVERQEFAHDEAAAIAALRATLSLRVPIRADETVEVLVDDEAKPRDVWEKPFFIDAGEHRISVHVPDGRHWNGTVTVVDGGKHLVVIPELAPSPAAADAPAERSTAPTPPPTVPPKPSAPARDDSAPKAGLGTEEIVALSLGAAGVVALGASVVLSVVASNTYDESEPFCRENDRCSAQGIRIREDAREDATSATVFGIAGGLALASAAVLWFVSGPGEESRVALNAGPAEISARLSGSF